MNTKNHLGLDEEEYVFSARQNRRIRMRSRTLLAELAKPVKTLIVASIATILLSVIMQTLGPFFLSRALDQGLPELIADNATPIILLAGAYILAAIVSALAMWGYVILAAKLSQNILFDLRTRVFGHTQRLSLDFHETYTSGRIISRQTSDLDAISSLLGDGLSSLSHGIFTILFTFVALMWLDPWSGLILLAAFIPIFAMTVFYHKRSQNYFRRSRIASARMIMKFVETMTGIRAVKGFRAQKRNKQEFGTSVEDLRQVTLAEFRLFAFFDSFILFVGNVGVAMIIFLGGIRIISGHLEVGVLLAAIFYARMFFSPIREIATFYSSYQSAVAALEKISGVLDQEPTIAEPEVPVKPLERKGRIVFDQVRFSYSPKKEILPECSLIIEPKQTIALVGETGAGKTTLAKLVSRFYDASAGRVMLDGVDIRDMALSELRHRVVMVTQEGYLFSGTIAENILLGNPKATRDEVIAAAQAAHVHDFIMSLPDGYDTQVNKRGSRFSAGQRQLLSCARAFLANPSVLILDEATSSLDIPSERAVQNALETLLSDRTALVIAHRLSTIAIADRVLVMERGVIIEDGSPQELIEAGGKFAARHEAWLQSVELQS